jgi:hypothetical protein
MRNLLIVLPLLFLGGCMSNNKAMPEVEPYKLDREWRPLKTVRERPTLLTNAASKTVSTTVGKHIYVHTLSEWLLRYVPGSAKFRALLRHEQEHSRRQLKMGTFLWIAKYSYDRKFALLEEQIGYYYEITERRRLGNPINIDGVALGLSKYQNLAGRLISFTEAKQWILDVLAGRWTPPA